MQDSAFQSICSQRLTIRRFAPEDAPALAAYRNDPEVARYQGFDSCTLDEARRFIAALADVDPGTPGVWFQFAVAAHGGGLLGDCALRCSRDEPAQAELGVSFARAHQGVGYAAEALRALLPYAFAKLELQRISAITDQRNRPAQRLLEGVGFHPEGSPRNGRHAEGPQAHECLYAIHAREWRVQP